MAPPDQNPGDHSGSMAFLVLSSSPRQGQSMGWQKFLLAKLPASHTHFAILEQTDRLLWSLWQNPSSFQNTSYD